MDTARFDHFARVTAMAGSRRGALRLLAGGMAAGLLPWRDTASAHAAQFEPELTVTCPSPLTNCGGVCVLTESNGSHCGACGNACEVYWTCLSGVCRSDLDIGRG